MAAKWFPFLGALFLFIWFSNLIGYIPLPTNSEETFNLFGAHIPDFALYAATANISVPLVLALVVFIVFNGVGIRAQGPVGYVKSLIPAGRPRPDAAPDRRRWRSSPTFMRLVSLTIRLFANILAGHMIILFMAGGLAVILGLSFLGWFTLPIGIARVPVRAGPGGHAAGLHLRHPRRHLYRWRGHSSLNTEGAELKCLHTSSRSPPRPRGRRGTRDRDRRRTRRRGRRRRHRDHLRQGHRGGHPPAGDARRDHQIQWLGFALTEACFFYGLVAGLISYVLK